ncbi:hypothetical protein Pssp01_33920 [Pseudomonas sp. NBRC 100443]|nr:hypothetical protein Pssp01_33920 [Pseudomonas sp. NBRC 100443]
MLAKGVLLVATVLSMDSVPSPQPSAARPALKGEGASPCREKGVVPAGNFRCCRLTPEPPFLPNGPLSLQGEG